MQFDKLMWLMRDTGFVRERLEDERVERINNFMRPHIESFHFLRKYHNEY